MSEPLLTAGEWAAMLREPLRDRSYQLTRLGAAVADFLAWKRLDGAAERTLDQYERDLARACVLFPDRTLTTLTSEDILHVITVLPPKSQKRARAALASMFRWAVLWGEVDRNPMDRIPTARQPEGRYVEVFTGRGGGGADQPARPARRGADGRPVGRRTAERRSQAFAGGAMSPR